MTPDPMPPMTMGVISSTSIKSPMLLQVDMDAALSKYHGVLDSVAAAVNAFSESAMAQRMVSRGGRNVDDKASMVVEISGDWIRGDEVQ